MPPHRRWLIVAAILLAGVLFVRWRMHGPRAALTPSATPGEPPAPRVVGSYGDMVNMLRDGGLANESMCEVPPSTEEERRRYEEVTARVRGPHSEAGAAPLRELIRMDDVVLTSTVRTRVLEKAMALGSTKLSEAERVIWLVDLLEGEVSNGGFHQYFSNSSGDCARKTLAAVRALDAPKLLALYERALAVFPSSLPAEDRKTRNEQMGRLTNEFAAWREHDDAFYALAREPILARYVRAHVAELDLPPRGT